MPQGQSTLAFSLSAEPATLSIGTAGWSVPRIVADQFEASGSALERYASRFDVAEINSSFYRAHRTSTWERWRDTTPAKFRFSVKLPKAITHKLKLVGCDCALDDFLKQTEALGPKLAVLLVQLPPSLAFDIALARSFFEAMRVRTSTAVVCEARHPSWFGDGADNVLSSLRVGRVGADPAICEAASFPGGYMGLAYWRLHGSPIMYRSSYGDRIANYHRLLTQSARLHDTWCIFDNTASSAAISDALALRKLSDGKKLSA